MREKAIAGAILDVFPVEPLPKESPLWAAEEEDSELDVVVSPHVGAVSKAKDVVGAFVAEFERRVKQLPPILPVDWNKGY